MTGISDIVLLELLDRRDHEFCASRGLVSAAQSLGVDITPSLLMRELRAIDETDLPCACRRQENRDGGMPRGWWRRD